MAFRSHLPRAALWFFPLILAVLGAQESPADTVRALIEKLRSDSIQERDEAARKLKEFGNSALPELEKAAKGADAEVVQRAQRLLRLIPVAETLTANLKKSLPGVEERLAFGDARAWTEVFMEAVEHDDGKLRHPGIKTEDLEALAVPALHGIKGGAEWHNVCGRLGAWKVRSALPEARNLLSSSDAGARSAAAHLFLYFDPADVPPELSKILEDPEPACRSHAAQVMGKSRIKGALPQLRKLVRDPAAVVRASAVAALGNLGEPASLTEVLQSIEDKDGRVRHEALEALRKLDAKQAARRAARLLEDPDAGVRWLAGNVLVDLDAREQIPEIAKLLVRPESKLRSIALQTLHRLDARDSAPVVLNLLRDPDPEVRVDAVGFLGDMGIVEAIPALRELLKDGTASVRDQAAECLCLLGVRESVSSLLETWARSKDDDWWSPYALNALRSGPAWQRLRRTFLPRELKGTREEVLNALGRSAGVSLELTGVTDTWRSEKVKVPHRGGHTSLILALWGLLQESKPDHEFILDADRIRILPRRHALAFWKEWWEKEGGK